MAIRNPRLPLLPGYSSNPVLGRTRFGVRPVFTSIDGINMLVDKPAKETTIPSLYARKTAPDLPSWIIFDKQILKFQAYFQQTLHEMRYGPSILRKVDILFFLEDGTIKVVEKKIDNSGLIQGVMISRHRIRLPYSNEFFDVLDLNIGSEVEFYGKKFKIYNCDNFTRVFLNRLGIHVPDPEVCPTYEKEVDPKLPCKSTRKVLTPMQKFLEYDRKVLRFMGFWDDRDTEFGTIHDIEILYYLADDTMQIMEKRGENSGSDTGSMLLKRSRVPKIIPPKIEMTGGPPISSYTPADLIIGGVLNIYGRKVVLTDCDPFTKEYYRERHGIDDFTPQSRPKDNSVECISSTMEERELPPWNGYGSYEDSAGNCRTVEPKAPHKDFMKFIRLDRFGFDSHTLRFAARLITDVPDYERRYFIISYFLGDDTMSIFELSERNSGFKGGRFLRRDKIYKPGFDKFAPKEPPTYTPQDMWVGNRLEINDHMFVLTACDEYALRYMELHNDQFPKANVSKIIEKTRRALVAGENKYKDFVAKYMDTVLPDRKDLIPIGCFRQGLREVFPELTEHEFITLARHYRGDLGKDGKPYRQMIRSMVFTQLNRELWDDRERLHEGLLHADEAGTGLLSRFRLRQILRGHRVPLSDQLMECMIKVLEGTEDCQVRYDDLMEFLDFKTSPCMHEYDLRAKEKLVKHSPPLKDTECQGWIDVENVVKCGYINWNKFLCDLKLDHIVKDK